MPPRKRNTRSSTAAASGRQNTLPFTSKITKPGAHTAAKSKLIESEPPAKTKDIGNAVKVLPVEDVAEAPSAAKSEDAPATPTAEDDAEPSEHAVKLPTAEPLSPTMAIRAAPPALSPDEQRARAVTDKQIEKYWAAKEEMRIFPRVHQKGLLLHDKILREFDLSSQYGPCIGIGRTRRWQRARKLGLDPPIEVLAVLMKEDAKDKGKKTDSQVAYVDELMGAKNLVEEVR